MSQHFSLCKVPGVKKHNESEFFNCDLAQFDMCSSIRFKSDSCWCDRLCEHSEENSCGFSPTEHAHISLSVIIHWLSDKVKYGGQADGDANLTWQDASVKALFIISLIVMMDCCLDQIWEKKKNNGVTVTRCVNAASESPSGWWCHFFCHPPKRITENAHTNCSVPGPRF